MSTPSNPYGAPVFNEPPQSSAIDEKKKRDAEMQTSDWILATLFAGIGLIMGIVFLVQGKRKAGKMLAISLLFVVIWNIVKYFVEMALKS